MPNRHRLFLLGRPELVGSEEELHIPFGKPLALLAFLARADRPVPREELAALLWPDSPDRRARQSVREALSRIRRTLGEDLFASDDPVELAPGRIWVDVDALEEALRSADPESATVLWRGTFLEELSIGDAPVWLRWKDETRTRLETRFGQALIREGEREAEGGDLSAAVRWFRRAAQVQPHSPEPHRRLLETLLQLRRFDAWEEAWGEARARLEPLDALGALLPLREAFEEAEREARHGPEEGGGPTVPFGGRGETLRALLDAWKATLQGDSRTVVLTGSTGVGKTRLVQEVADRVRPRATVLAVKPGEDARGDTLGLVRILTSRLRGLPGSMGTARESENLLQRMAGASPADAPNDPEAVATALDDLLGAVTFEAPLLLVVDDVHRADTASLLVLDELVRRDRDFPCLLLILSRSGEGSARIREALGRWCVTPGVRCLPIHPLTREAVTGLVRSFARVPDGPDGEEILEQIHELTQGNALFLVELMEALFQAGVLRFVEGRWAFARTDLSSVVSESSTVAALITTRLERLDPEARAVVAHLAQQDGPTPVLRLQRACGMESSSFVRAVSLLAERRIVRWVDDVRVDVAHDRFREVGRKLPAPSGVWWRGRPRMAAAAAAVIVLAVGVMAGWLSLGANEAPEAFYGGGHLLAVGPDTTVELVPEGRPGPWRVVPPRIPVPRDRPERVWKPRPSVMRSGEIVWTAQQRDVDEPPFVVRIEEGGALDTLFRTGGDTGLGGISPDGRWLAVSTEDLTTPVYDRSVVLQELGGPVRRVVYRNGSVLQSPTWSPDGRLLLTKVPGSDADSAMVLTREGGVVGRLSGERIVDATWCGSSERVVALLRGRSGDAEIVMWNVTDGRVQTVLQAVAAPPLLCSPDGRAVAYREAVDRRLRLVVHDMERGVRSVVDELDPELIPHLAWVPSRVPQQPRSLLVSPPPDSLPWGRSVQLDAWLVHDGGVELRTSPRWSSSDPSVARVDAGGRVHANRPGRAVIRAAYQGWLTDSVAIRVVGSGRGPLLEESFEELDTTVWIPGGEPRPVADSVEGEPVLRLTGDGVWVDGVISKRSFELPRGGTVEMEFRLPLTRPDRQRVRLCLFQGEPPAGPARHDPVEWDFETQVCMVRPAGELQTLRPSGVGFKAGIWHELDFPDLFPTDDWVHFGLQLRPDGEVTFIVDRRPVWVDPILMDNAPGSRWRIMVIGASVDTEAFVRDLVLWEGPRYGF